MIINFLLAKTLNIKKQSYHYSIVSWFIEFYLFIFSYSDFIFFTFLNFFYNNFFLLLPTFIFALYILILFISTIEIYIINPNYKNKKFFFIYGFLSFYYIFFSFLFIFVIISCCLCWLFILFKIYFFTYFLNNYEFSNCLILLKILSILLKNYIYISLLPFSFLFNLIFQIFLFFSFFKYFLFDFFFFFLPTYLSYLTLFPIYIYFIFKYLFFINTFGNFFLIFFFLIFLEIIIFFFLIFLLYFLIVPLGIPLIIIFLSKFFYDVCTHDVNILEKVLHSITSLYYNELNNFPYYLKIVYLKYIFISHFLPTLTQVYIQIIYLFFFLPFDFIDTNFDTIYFYVSMATYLFFISGLTLIEKTFFEPSFLPYLHLIFFEDYIFDVALPKIIKLSNFFYEEIQLYLVLYSSKYSLVDTIIFYNLFENITKITNFNFYGVFFVMFSYTFLIYPTICIYCACIIFFWTTFLIPLEYLNSVNLRKLININDPRTYSQLIFSDVKKFLNYLYIDYKIFMSIKFNFFKNLNTFWIDIFFSFEQFIKKRTKKNFLIFFFKIFKLKYLFKIFMFDVFLLITFIKNFFNKYYKKVLIYTALSKDISSLNYTGLEAIETILYFSYFILFIPQTSILLLEFFFNFSYYSEIKNFYIIVCIYILTLFIYLYYVSCGTIFLTYLHLKLKILKILTFFYKYLLILKFFIFYLYKNLIKNFNPKLILNDLIENFNTLMKPIYEIHEKDTLFDIDNIIMYTIALPSYFLKYSLFAKIITTDILSYEKKTKYISFLYRTRESQLGVLYPRLLDKIAESFTWRAFIFYRRAKLYKKDKKEEENIEFLINNGWTIQKSSLIRFLEIFFMNRRIKLNLYIDFKDEMEDAVVRINKIYFTKLFNNFTNIKDALKKIPKLKTYFAYPYKKEAEGLDIFFYFSNRVCTLFEMFFIYKLFSFITCWEILLNEFLYFDTEKFNNKVISIKKEEQKKKEYEKIKKPNSLNEDFFTVLENLRLSEEKTKHLSLFNKIYKCIFYQSFFYLDDHFYTENLNSNTSSLNQSTINSILERLIQYLDFFIINLDTIDEDALHKKQIEFIEYYLYFKFLKILKKKLNKIAYAFNTKHPNRTPFKIFYLKSDYTVFINLAKFLDKLPKNNISNKNYIPFDIDYLDDGTIFVHFITDEFKNIKFKKENEKNKQIQKFHWFVIFYFIFLCAFFFTILIREPFIILNGFGSVPEYFLFVFTW